VAPVLTRIAEVATRVANSDIPVLILGESGVGKGVLAQYIHSCSSRRNQAFVKVNCAALPRELMESELFGYERGAFTGAVDRKPGKFELADGGSILLDEIAEMSPALQAKLLHVLQDQEYSRLGATQSIRVTSRILATTNKRPETAVKNGEFRGDLLYRLNVVRLDIPPLREHMNDVPALCRYFINKYAPRYCGVESVELPRRLLSAFCSYPWPGNVRQLENAIKQFLILGAEELVLQSLRESAPEAESNCRLEPARPLPEERSLTVVHSRNLKDIAAKAAEQAEKEVVLGALNERHWNRKGVAKELGISYKTLLFKLRRWNGDKTG
jgi:two-component system response regulator AtoC